MGFRTRAVRHCLAAVALVLVVCAVVATFSALTLASARSDLAPLTARAQAHVAAVDHDADTATVTWTPPSGPPARATVELDGSAPAPGATVPVGYDPSNPSHAVIPGAVSLIAADRSSGELLFIAIVAVVLLIVTAVRLLSRLGLTRRPQVRVPVRRVRIQSGLLARSWLETEDIPRRWVPVYFEPALITLPTPTTVAFFGDPRRNRLVAAVIDDTVLYPSGRVVKDDPRGRRVDNPSEIDDSVRARAVTTLGLLPQLRADAVLIVPAPLIGLLWAFLDGGGVWSWLGATVITAALALWLAALRGSDPS
ncbi:hypothetical protein [Kutzneria sp. CA-103260]|uniref:hypothetical protein n=1 Tax=Kutzneria sp. CA-103260 TaxID=2802641 RepID=UPI001BAA57D6|nr:hypothetical protein [Kutzneria sp. CA-103260]QUQ68920.1 hypothetical protein JJ691_66690 [Kutzneria sp. CA-103260]